MKIEDQIKIIQEAIDKLQFRFEEAVKDNDFIKSQQIDYVIYRLNDGKRKLEKRRNDEKTL